MNDAAHESFWQRMCPALTPRDRRNQARFTLLMALWALVFLLSTALVVTERVGPGPVGWIVAGLPAVFAVFAVLAYLRYLREADELARTIELRALALAMCAGFVVWPVPGLLGRLGVPVSELGLPVLVISGFYAFGSVLGWRKYR